MTPENENQSENTRGDEQEQPAADENQPEENQPAAAAKVPEQKPQEAEAPEDLFDLMGEEGKQHKKKKPEPAHRPTSSAAKDKKPPEPQSFPRGVQIAYSGHKIDLPRDMNVEELLEFLADDFPELTRESTEFTHDKDKNRVVPNRKALKKGAAQMQDGASEYSSPTFAVPPDKNFEEQEKPRSFTVHTRLVGQPLPPVHRVLANDGVYEIRDTPLGTFTARMPAQTKLAETVYLKVPRAPVALLRKTLRIFKQRPDREMLVTVVYDHRDGAHRLVWVEQCATATSIDYDPVVENEHLTVYCEIHSHNRMDAFFSATDDSSEVKSGGLHGVIGRVEDPRPPARFRYSCGEHFRDIPAVDLFEPAERIPELITEAGP